jgi:hypothetical protein
MLYFKFTGDMVLSIFLAYRFCFDDLHMLCRMIVNGWYLPAFGTLALSGASDWVRLHHSNVATILISYVQKLAHRLFSNHSWMGS